MNLNYRVEEAFDNLENAIVEQLHDSTSAADAERYAQLLDDIVGLRDGVKKETAPAVGATEAAKKDSSKESTSSVAENGGDVNPRGSLNIQIIDQDSIKSTLRKESKGKKRERQAACAAAPTLEEVKGFFKGRPGDPERFWHYHEATGWVVHGEPVTNWRALAENWIRNERQKPEPETPHTPSYDLEEYESFDIFSKEQIT